MSYEYRLGRDTEVCEAEFRTGMIRARRVSTSNAAFEACGREEQQRKDIGIDRGAM